MQCRTYFFFIFTFICSVQGELSHLSLQRAEEIALKNNKPYLMAEQNQKAQRQKYLQSASSLFPSISYQGSYTRTLKPALVEDVRNARLSFEKNLLIQKFELVQPIISTDLIFGFKEQKLVSESYTQMTESTKNNLLFDLRDSYFYLLFNQIALKIRQENVEYLQNALNVEEGKYRLGNATSLEVNQSKVAVTNAISLYYDTIKIWKEARNKLVHVLGVDPEKESSLHISVDNFPLEKIPLIRNKIERMKETHNFDASHFPSMQGLEEQEESLSETKNLSLFAPYELNHFVHLAFSLRPDLKVKKLSVNIAEENVRKSKAKYAPFVTSFIDYTQNGGEPSARFFSKDNFSWALGVKFSWTIFDSLRRERKVRQSRYEKNSAYYDYIYAKQTIETSIRNLLYQIEDSIYAYLTASSGVLVAHQSMIQAKEKLSFGKIPPLQYRDAANQLAEAQNLKNRAAYYLMMNYFYFRKTLGLDMKPDGLFYTESIRNERL